MDEIASRNDDSRSPFVSRDQRFDFVIFIKKSTGRRRMYYQIKQLKNMHFRDHR